jgi:hypothetical protein
MPATDPEAVALARQRDQDIRDQGYREAETDGRIKSLERRDLEVNGQIKALKAEVHEGNRALTEEVRQVATKVDRFLTRKEQRESDDQDFGQQAVTRREKIFGAAVAASAVGTLVLAVTQAVHG